MKAVNFALFILAGSSVIGIYIIAPLIASLRPLVGNMFLALALALVIVIGCTAKAVSILRVTAPFVPDSSGLLEMPSLSPTFPSHYEILEETRLVISRSRHFEALVDSTGSSGAVF